jgi:hypothetical protein
MVPAANVTRGDRGLENPFPREKTTIASSILVFPLWRYGNYFRGAIQLAVNQ